MTIRSINPATGNTVQTYTAHTAPYIEAALECATHAQQNWRQTDIAARAKLIHRLAEVLESHTDEHAITMTTEMGKTLSASHAEIDKCVQYCRYTADNATLFLSDTHVETKYKKAFTRPLPLGVILLVMPWNFPFWQVLRVAVSAILSGNTCILKHASNVPTCALALEDLFRRAGFPKGIFQTLFIRASQVAPLLQDERIAGASLTGSEQAGATVASLCGKHIKKCVLELGGSDPFIVMPSADLGAAIEAAYISRTRNNGQSCIAAKRLIIHRDIYDDFKFGYLKKLKDMNIGDPLHSGTDLGPISSKQAFDETTAMLANAAAQGAAMTQTSHELPKTGYYMRPGIIEGVGKDMDIYGQEIFAPIAMLFKVQSLEQAIILGNDIPYGLSSVLFSTDNQEQDLAIARLEAGSTYINRYASSDIRMPFGGIKRSGYGREMAKEGMLEFTNLKTIIVAK